MNAPRRRAALLLVGAASLAGTAACGLVIGLSDHEAYPAEGGTGDATQETTTPETGGPETGGEAATAEAGDAGTDVTDAGPGCDGSVCGSACVDTQNDDNNCGGCNVTCDAGACYRGTCGGRQVTGITAGTSHACALLRAGDVWCWGADDQAQILGPTGAGSCPGGPCRAPTRIPGLPNAVQISAGGDQTCAVESKGGVWCWGANAKGGLGHGPGGDPTCTTADGGVACNPTPTKVAGLAPATSVSSGQIGFACALVGSTVYCWGDDSQGELGPVGDGGPSASPVIVAGNASALSAGYDHVCAILAGTPACWGSNVSGELGHTPGLGDQTCAGGTPCEPAPQTIAVAGASGVHAGFQASCFTTGSVPSCLGANDVSQLGTSSDDTSPHTIPVPVTVQSSISSLDFGYRTVCAISSGSAHCWGDDQTHQTSASAPVSCVGGSCQTGSIAVALTGS
ncbi:MAG TPA: hypothetical protein VIF09_09105, partial [Polyangiaceae bacterium]